MMKGLIYILIWLLSSFAPIAGHAQSDPDPDPEKYYPVDEPPVPLNLAYIKRKIVYPRHLSKSGQEGKVLLRVLVDTLGRIERHQILKASYPEFVEAIVPLLPELKFHPAVYQKRKTKFWVVMPFYFKLPSRKKQVHVE